MKSSLRLYRTMIFPLFSALYRYFEVKPSHTAPNRKAQAWHQTPRRSFFSHPVVLNALPLPCPSPSQWLCRFS